jgi:hypothetical protein
VSFAAITLCVASQRMFVVVFVVVAFRYRLSPEILRYILVQQYFCPFVISRKYILKSLSILI